jgi:hypothetical protein
MSKRFAQLFALDQLDVHRPNLGSVDAYKNLLCWMAIFNMNAWIWSAIFHTRDTPFTEKMDYFSALLNVFFGIYMGIAWVNGPKHWLSSIAGLSFGAYYVYHICYLTFWKFDYGYHMIVAILAGLAHSLIWLVYSFTKWVRPVVSSSADSKKAYGNRLAFGARHPYIWYGVMGITGVLVSLSLEILDFDPIWRVIDAHSLWHLSTAFFCLPIYAFCIHDLYWPRQKQVTNKKM